MYIFIQVVLNYTSINIYIYNTDSIQHQVYNNNLIE